MAGQELTGSSMAGMELTGSSMAGMELTGSSIAGMELTGSSKRAGSDDEHEWATTLCRANRAAAEPTGSNKSGGSDEEHEWATTLCRAKRAAAEPTGSNKSANSDDEDHEWLTTLCTYQRPAVPEPPVCRMRPPSPVRPRSQSRSRSLRHPGSTVSAAHAPGWMWAARLRQRSRSRLRHQQLSGSELSSGVKPTVSRRNSGVLRHTSAEPTSEGVFPEWRDGRAMVLRGRTTSVRQIADARASLATSTSGYAGGVSRGSDMIWHFPLDLTEGIEWRLMCRSAEAMVSECLGRLPTVFKIGITSDPLHRWANPSYGYCREGYQSMTLLAATTPEWAAALECHLIDSALSAHGHGCRNVALGGESCPREPPVFVYVVTVLAEEFNRWILARNRARLPW